MHDQVPGQPAFVRLSVKSPRSSWKLTHLLPPPFHVRVPFPQIIDRNDNQHMKTLFEVKTQTFKQTNQLNKITKHQMLNHDIGRMDICKDCVRDEKTIEWAGRGDALI